MGDIIRVLHIASGDGWGGAESQLSGLLHALNDRPRVNCTAITLNGGLLAERLHEAGVTCHVIDESKHNSSRLWRALRRKIKETHPDIVHSHGYKQNVLGSLAAIGQGCRCIRTQHGGWEIPGRLPTKGGLYRTADWLAARFVQDRVVAVSESLGAVLENRLPRKKIVVIKNGVDIEALAPLAKKGPDHARRDPLVIAFVGRLVPVKRIDLFLEAAAILLKQTERALFFEIYGEGPLHSEAVALANRLGITESVRFRGFVPDLSKHLVDADILMMTSDHEGLPMVLLEALYLQVPVVAPAVGGIADVLCSDYGALVSEQNPRAYAESVLNCIDRERSLSKSMEQAPAFIEQHYSASRQALAYEQLYRGLVNQS